MRTIILILCCVGILSACTQQDVINSGVSSPYHDCNMMDYMRGDTYNWELTVQMIEHAGLTDLFEGKVDSMPVITFWGIPSYSIQRFIFDSHENEDLTKVYTKVSDIPKSLCREFLLKHVTKGKILKEDIAYKIKNSRSMNRGRTGELGLPVWRGIVLSLTGRVAITPGYRMPEKSV